MCSEPAGANPAARDVTAPRISSAVIVAPSPVPLRLGGAERHWEGLRSALEQAGVAVDLVKLPVREHTLCDLLDAYEAFLLLDLSHADLVITGKYPAWMVQHPNHVVWMLHPLRGLYDTYDPTAHRRPRRSPGDPVGSVLDLLGAPVDIGPLQVIDEVRHLAQQLGPAASEPGGPLALPGPLPREVVRFLDRWALDGRRVRRHMAISEVVADRPGYFPLGVAPEVMIPPSCLAEPEPTPVPAGAGQEPVEYLAVGRLDRPKRIDLAIAGFSRLDAPNARLVIVGDGPDRERLGHAAAGDERITFAGRISDEELATAYRRCRAALVTPEAEDFGYVTIEALAAGRPVVTTSDAGGPAELVTDDLDGLVVAPEPAAIHAALERLHHDDELAARLGRSAIATAASHSWPAVVRRILSEVPPRPPAEGHRGRIAALSTYPVAGWPGGGPERARRLLGALAEAGWQVELVAIAPGGGGGASGRSASRPGDGVVEDIGGHIPPLTPLADGFTEVLAPLSRRHLAADTRLRRLTANLAVSDITASVLWPASGDLVAAARHALEGADAVIAVQPYLAPMAIELAPRVPLVLDAHNHERTLKSQMLPGDEAGRWMLDRVTDAEGLAVTRAALVVASTEFDARSLETDHGLAPGSVSVIPNGVDTDAVRIPTPAEHDSAKRSLLSELSGDLRVEHLALFVGSAHRPNIDAAREILAIAPAMAEVLFVLAGEHCDQIDPHDRPANVRCLGRVSEGRLGELLTAADVALNPMRSGGGSNLKVLGYFAAGIPVVSTPTGVRGISEPQRFATVARIDRFTDAVRSVIGDSNDADLRGRLVDRTVEARRLVESTYDWSVISALFAERVGSLATARDPYPMDQDL